MRLRLWFTDHVLFGRKASFFIPNGESEAENRQRELALEAHERAKRKMDEVNRMMEEVTTLAGESGSSGRA